MYNKRRSNFLLIISSVWLKKINLHEICIKICSSNASKYLLCGKNKDTNYDKL